MAWWNTWYTLGKQNNQHSGDRHYSFQPRIQNKAIILAEIGVHNSCTAYPDLELNSKHLRANLDLLEEAKEDAAIKMAIWAQQVSKYYNHRVNNRQFQVSDLVLWNCEASRPTEEWKKLSLNSKRPYQINKILGFGAYKLADLSGRIIPNTWNAVHLKKYYL